MLLVAFVCLLYCLPAFLQALFAWYHLMEFASGIEKVLWRPIMLHAWIWVTYRFCTPHALSCWLRHHAGCSSTHLLHFNFPGKHLLSQNTLFTKQTTDKSYHDFKLFKKHRTDKNCYNFKLFKKHRTDKYCYNFKLFKKHRTDKHCYNFKLFKKHRTDKH